MAPMKLYKMDLSPAVRSVLVTAAALEITFDEYDLDMLNNEHLSAEYLKMNPLHTVPTLNDNGRIVYDSHAINGYIVGKCGKNDSLYPKDIYNRALVDQANAFDLGILYPILKDIDLAYIAKEIKSLTPKMVTTVTTAYNFLEVILEGKQWIALDHVTIADFSCYTTISSLEFHIEIDAKTYPNIKSWMNRCQKLPCFSKDPEKLQKFKDIMKSFCC